MKNSYRFIYMDIMRHGVGVTSLISFWGLCDYKRIIFHVKDVMQKYE